MSETYCDAPPRFRFAAALRRDCGRTSFSPERESLSELNPELEAGVIWRRRSSIDGDEDDCAGSWSPSISQRTLVRGTIRFRRYEALAPHDVFMAPPRSKLF
jgi:hypothetical protein